MCWAMCSQRSRHRYLLRETEEDGKLLKVANLVDDDNDRPKVRAYLRTIQSADDMDIIIALGMAKRLLTGPIASMC